MLIEIFGETAVVTIITLWIGIAIFALTHPYTVARWLNKKLNLPNNNTEKPLFKSIILEDEHY